MAEDKKKTAELAVKFHSLFEGFDRAHGTHGEPDLDTDGLKWKIKRTARTLREPPTLELWQQHLRGERPLGVIPIRADNSCSWGSIDFDEYDVELTELIGRVERAKLPLVPCRSKSGGLHLFLFLRSPEPASNVQAALRDAAAGLGMAECEIFPKQTQILADRNDAGSWMVMPYYGDTYGGKLKTQVGLKKTGAEMSAPEFLRFAEEKRTTLVEFAKLCVVRRMPQAADGKKRRKGAPGRGDFTDGPPCLQHITASGVQADGRKRTIFMMALYYKRCDPDNWKQRLETANQTFFSPPLPADEIISTIRSCERKDYEYTCKEEPMRSHCDKVTCRGRRFGVGRGGEFPELRGIRKLMTDPPLWFVDVADQTLELTSDELQSYIKFHRACMDRVGKCYQIIKQDTWFAMLAEAMENAEPIPAPPEASRLEIFRELLETFLTNRARGEKSEDLQSGRPFESVEEGRYYFRMRDLERFLKRERAPFADDRRAVANMLRKLEGGPKKFNWKNEKSCNAMYVPSKQIERTPDLEILMPPTEKI